jgi:hypothetical protein
MSLAPASVGEALDAVGASDGSDVAWGPSCELGESGSLPDAEQAAKPNNAQSSAGQRVAAFAPPTGPMSAIPRA